MSVFLRGWKIEDLLLWMGESLDGVDGFGRSWKVAGGELALCHSGELFSGVDWWFSRRRREFRFWEIRKSPVVFGCLRLGRLALMAAPVGVWQMYVLPRLSGMGVLVGLEKCVGDDSVEVGWYGPPSVTS